MATNPYEPPREKSSPTPKSWVTMLTWRDIRLTAIFIGLWGMTFWVWLLNSKQGLAASSYFKIGIAINALATGLWLLRMARRIMKGRRS